MNRLNTKFKNVKLNFVFASISQMIAIFFAMIIPRMIIAQYGSEIHGLTSVISNMITYLTLVEAGLGAASVQSLYAPLEKEDYYEVNAEINAINIFYRRIAVIFAILVVLLAVVYPLFLSYEIDSFVVMALILVSGLTQVIEFLFCKKYKLLLQADKKMYVINAVNIVGVVIQGVSRLGLIYLGKSIIVVQLVPSVVYICRLILLKIYINKEYNYLDSSVKPNFDVGKSKWSALIHQISSLIVTNTDTIVLSVFSGYSAVSIYSVYNMVTSNLNSFLNQTISNALVANFGHIISHNNKNELINYYNIYEKIYCYIVAFIFGMCGNMLLPFVRLYCNNLSKINYVDKWLAILFVLNAILHNIRVPEMTIINAAGRFKETQLHSIIEALLNLVSSIILVRFLGIYGVLLGTTLAYGFRDILYVWYLNKKMLGRKVLQSIYNYIHMVALMIIIIAFGQKLFMLRPVHNWIQWLSTAIVNAFFAAIIIILHVLAFNRSLFKLLRNNL